MKHTKVIHKLFFVVVIAFLSAPSLQVAAVEDSVDFQVNVKDTLSVSITTPDVWASGNIDEFLRNTIDLSISTNTTGGFTATMTSKTPTTSLVNTSKSTITLPTLSSTSTRGSFPANYWGYSVDDTTAGDASSNYSAMVPSTAATPITILTSQSSSGNKTFYFGAKADARQAAGTYTGVVVINVVTGVIDNNTNPITPENPATPNGDEVATYDGEATTYTTRTTTSGRTTTSTVVTEGDNRAKYGYLPAMGETYSVDSSLATGITLATGFGIAASIAATSGFFFLSAARREGEDDDEDEEQY